MKGTDHNPCCLVLRLPDLPVSTGHEACREEKDAVQVPRGPGDTNQPRNQVLRRRATNERERRGRTKGSKQGPTAAPYDRESFLIGPNSRQITKSWLLKQKENSVSLRLPFGTGPNAEAAYSHDSHSTRPPGSPRASTPRCCAGLVCAGPSQLSCLGQLLVTTAESPRLVLSTVLNQF